MHTDKTEEEQEEERIQAIAIAVTAILIPLLCEDDPIPENTSILTGHLYYQETMANPNENNFLHVTRMDKPTFEKLHHLLTTKGQLKDGREITAGEKIFTFLHVLKGHSVKATGHRFQHSKSTIHDTVYEMICSMQRCKNDLLRQPKEGDPVNNRIRLNPKFFPFFENAVGALDGSHVPAKVSGAKQDRCRNRKGWPSQNVLGVCDFDMLFTYVLSGWEGQAHDGKVLADASENQGLTCPPGKYYLADAGYALSWMTLTPYRGVRYHLKEWSRAPDKPQNKEELFNLRHASLRNVVERIYGVSQTRFPVLTQMGSYPFTTQAWLVQCVFMIHNFIRRETIYEDYFYAEYDAAQAEEEEDEEEEEGPTYNDRDPADFAALNVWRDDIAQRMWVSYLLECVRRGNV
jgi:hypothetical protein